MSKSIKIEIDKLSKVKKMAHAVDFTHGRGGFHKSKKTRSRDRMSETVKPVDLCGFCDGISVCEDKLIDRNVCQECRNKILPKSIRIGKSKDLTAFDNLTIGTAVFDDLEFLRITSKLISEHNFEQDRVPGQALIQIPKPEKVLLSGVGKYDGDNPKDFLVRYYRGKMGLYLDRKFASPVSNGSFVVYTREAYLNDPDVNEEEQKRIIDCNYTHIIVAVLANSFSNAPLSSHRFVHNLAGGNNEALLWSADEIRQKAREIIEYWSEGWYTVSD